jgi:hypothetical protein
MNYSRPLQYTLGTITPASGVVGDTTVFLLFPGTATMDNMSFLMRGYIPLICDYEYPCHHRAIVQIPAIIP